MMSHKAVALHAGIAVFVSVLAAGCTRTETLGGGDSAQRVHAPFDSATWKSGNDSARGQMADDLIDRRLLIGKTRAEVIAMLGEPDQDGGGSLGYFVYFSTDNAARPAYVIRVEFDKHRKLVKDAHFDTDLWPEYSGVD